MLSGKILLCCTKYSITSTSNSKTHATIILMSNLSQAQFHVTEQQLKQNGKYDAYISLTPQLER